MGELIIDLITSLDGYASAEGWPGWWGLEGPEYLRWLDERPESTLLMGANTYRLMSGFAAGATPAGIDELPTDEKNTFGGLTEASKGKGVFSRRTRHDRQQNLRRADPARGVPATSPRTPTAPHHRR